jgi:hypothetical protein
MQGQTERFSDQVRGATESASELWEDAYEQGQRYYRQGSQALAEVDATTLSGWLVAGGIGFGLAWLLFGHRSRYADDMTRRMSEASDSHGSERNNRSRANRRQ